MAHKDLTAERLRFLLDYDPETGIFVWKHITSKRVKVGDIAGFADHHGYISIGVDGFAHRAHRLAWLYVTGQHPSKFLDHINGKRTDNRFANLREASFALNSQNQCNTRTNNTSGFIGVTWCKPLEKWRARISLRGKHLHLGLFETPTEARAAYLAAKRVLHVGARIDHDCS